MRKSILMMLGVVLLAGMAMGEESKDANPPPFNLGFAEQTGGPDPFGYTYLDSAAPGGPVYAWNDISGTGVDMGLSDDSHFYSIALPFDFDFYGATYNQIAVGSNGTVYFEDDYLGLGNVCIPGTNSYTPQTFIAGYWDDLNPGDEGSGAVYYEIVGLAGSRQLIVQWDNVAHYGGPDSVTFQVILYEGSNNIRAQYSDPSGEAGSGATEGIQGDPNTGLEYACDLGALTANLAICYVHPASGDPNCEGAPVPTMNSAGVVTLMVALLAVSMLALRRRRAV